MEAGPREPVSLDSRTSYRSELLEVGITSSSYFEKAGRLKAEISIVAHGSCHGADVPADGPFIRTGVTGTGLCHPPMHTATAITGTALGLPISIGPLN